MGIARGSGWRAQSQAGGGRGPSTVGWPGGLPENAALLGFHCTRLSFPNSSANATELRMFSHSSTELLNLWSGPCWEAGVGDSSGAKRGR